MLQAATPFPLEGEKQKAWSDCTDAQADLRLYCSHATKSDFLTSGSISSVFKSNQNAISYG